MIMPFGGAEQAHPVEVLLGQVADVAAEGLELLIIQGAVDGGELRAIAAEDNLFPDLDWRLLV